MKRLLSFPSPGAPALLIVLIGALVVPTSAVAEYKLQAGDVLEISVMGVPELRQRSPIEVGGAIALPLVGQIKVGGLSTLEARSKITAVLSNKVYPQRASDG